MNQNWICYTIGFFFSVFNFNKVKPIWLDNLASSIRFLKLAFTELVECVFCGVAFTFTCLCSNSGTVMIFASESF